MLPAIDIHAHFGNPACFPQKGLAKDFLSLSMEAFQRDCRCSRIAAACISPMEAIFPATSDALLAANLHMRKLAEENPLFYQWVVIDPLFPESFAQADAMLDSPKCVGVKLHPDGHGYDIRHYGDSLFDFCARRNALVEVHTGDPLSNPMWLVPYVDRYPQVRVIAAHLGYGKNGDLQVNAIEKSRNGNLYTDISSVKSLQNHLLEWAVERVGAERLLFGTDCPIHHIPMMRARVDGSTLSDTQKQKILYENALALTGIQDYFEKEVLT